MDTLKTAIETAELENIDSSDKRVLEAIYIAGGSVGFPLVRSKLRDQFGKKVRISPHPQASIAVGLSISADTARIAHLGEAVPRNLGVWREYGTNIKKRTTCPKEICRLKFGVNNSPASSRSEWPHIHDENLD